MPLSLNNNVVVKDKGGVNRTFTVKALLIAVAPFLATVMQEWTGKDILSYFKFQVGMRNSQFKNDIDADTD